MRVLRLALCLRGITNYAVFCPDDEGIRMERLTRLLFPDPPRPIPAHRPLGIALRTAHLMCFGTLVGGHVFDVEPSRLLPFLIATIGTGIALMALELISTCAWLFMGKGVMVLAKLLLLLLIPVFWEHRVALLLTTVVVASVGSHMPARFRHFSFLQRWRAEPVEPLRMDIVQRR